MAAPDTKGLRTDEWIQDVLDRAPEGATLIVAFVGKHLSSGKKGSGLRRLYASAALDDYIEVAEEDIVAYQPLPETYSPLGGSAVWLRRDAHVQRVQTTARQAQAGMLAGSDFTRNSGGTPGAGNPPAGTLQPFAGLYRPSEGAGGCTNSLTPGLCQGI